MSEDALRAKSLRRRILVQRKVSTPEADGGEAISYADRVSLYARVRPLSGREALVAQEFAPLAQYEFTIRHRTDIEMTDRVVWKGVAYDIQYLAEVGRNVGLRILAKRPGAEAS